MIYSMTGYASATRELATAAGNGSASVSVELRTVNSRFLDLNFRMPDDVRACEPALREMLMGKLSRGKVDVRINLQRGEQSIGAGALNQTALGQLAELERSVLDAFRASAACAPVKSCAGPACWPKRRVRGRDPRRGARVRQGSDRRAGRGALARRRALATMLLSNVTEMEAIVARASRRSCRS
jgi:uncharacterized protein YicC (UPF0701 family)